MSKLKQIKSSELRKLRERIHTNQGGWCPLLRLHIDIENMVVDHQHSTKSEVVGDAGAGLIRGVIDFRANSFEGRAYGLYKRSGLVEMISFSGLLRNLACYLDGDPLELDGSYLIHPSEKPKMKKLQKASFNRLKRVYLKKTRLKLDYPVSGKVTVKLKALFKDYNIEPKFYA